MKTIRNLTRFGINNSDTSPYIESTLDESKTSQALSDVKNY